MIDSYMPHVAAPISLIVFELASLAYRHEMAPCEILDVAGLSHGYPLAASLV